MARRNQLRPTLNLTTSQRLAMTPSLLQKIELLTLNQLELSELMNQEMIENPFLDEVADGAESENQESDSSGSEVKEGSQVGEEVEAGKDAEAESEKNEQLDDLEFEYFFGDYLNPPSRAGQYEHDPDRPTFELFLAASSSLTDHLNWQLNCAELKPEIRLIADYIVGNLDEDGYLSVSVEEIADELAVSVDTVESTLVVIQHLDPIGVGARDVRECLLVQIRAAGLQGTFAERLVANHLLLLEKRKYKEIARELGCDVADIGGILEEIRQFSPQPGQKYNSKEPIYIRPDVYLSKVDDEYHVMLNDDGLPRLRLNRAYRRVLLKGNEVSKDTKSYVKERFRSAVELLRSIDQRQQTIFRVCNAIIERQRTFLEKGKMHLKPMLIKDIAEELGVHPSTISRVVANKYAHTPQGVIELRRFFTVGVENSDGQTISTVHVKEKIKKIIEAEDSRRPLSDQKISEILRIDAIEITRRTVAKYRDQMKIPGSRERKMRLPI